jgi:hypothetical protein
LTFFNLNSIQQIQYKLIFHNFIFSQSAAASVSIYTPDGKKYYTGYNPLWYPDTTIIFYDSTHIGKDISTSNGNYIIRTIESSYYGSPGYIDNYMIDILGESYSSSAFENKFQQELGVYPFSRTVTTAKKEPFHFWSGIAVEKMFYKYYGKPINPFQHVTFGFIYNLAAKKYMNDYVQLLNHLLVDKKEQWVQQCNSYLKNALKDSTFEGTIASINTVDQLFTEKDKSKLKVIDKNYLYIPVGELMRRQIDGSLPSIIKCIKVILKDYDPNNLKMLKAI